MAGNPFDREVFNPRERPLSPDQNLLASYADLEMREVFANSFLKRVSLSDDGNAPMITAGQAKFLGDGFRVKAASPAAMQVVVRSGLGWINSGSSDLSIGGLSGMDDRSLYKPLSLTANEVIVVPAAPGVGLERTDIIEVAVDRRLADSTSREILNPGTGIFAAGPINKTLTYNQNGRSSVNGSGSINYKTGTPAAAGTSVAPATTAGYVKISEVLVDAGVTTIVQNKIKDLRSMMWANGYRDLSVAFDNSVFGVSLSAPAGVQLGVVFTPANLYTLYLVAGLNSVATAPQFSAMSTSATLNGIFIYNLSGGGLNALLADQIAAASASPSVSLAIGQPFYKLSFSIVGQLNGVTSTAVLPTTSVLSGRIALS